ncbi:MAG: 4Fe-4S binding protein [Deltaproteobacteria bacterium]|nr:4Fe-4S binding protein [Deltaproteobacteria bacterium]
MASLASRGLNWVRSLFASAEEGPALAGLPAVLNGATAVAITEACLAEVAGVGGSDASLSLALAWDQERASRTLNLFGAPLDDVAAADPRGVLAAALGLSMGGLRATAFTTTAQLAVQQDLLSRAAGQHLPLVLHVVAEGLAGHGSTHGSGHEGLFAASDAGWFQLIARTAQEASDLALVARWVAERALVPGMVVMDGEETARSAQDLLLPDPRLILQYLGDAGDTIPSPTPAQRLIFGAERRRSPRWYDLDDPALVGATYTEEHYALGAAGQAPFYSDGLLALIEEGMAALSALTGRALSPVAVQGPAGAPLGVITLGSASESVAALSRFSNGAGAAAQITLRVLRPFPGAALVRALDGLKTVAVLERVPAGLSEDPALTREVRSALARAGENARFGEATHQGYPALSEARHPRLVPASWGLGGQPLRPTDLQALYNRMEAGTAGPAVLGVRFDGGRSDRPRRQALLDALKHSWPELSRRGVRGDSWIDIRPEGSVTVAIHRREGSYGAQIAAELGQTLISLASGGVRGYCPARPVGALVQERLTWGPAQIGDAGADNLADVAVILDREAFHGALKGLAHGGCLICAQPGEPRPHLLPQDIVHALEEREIKFYALSLSVAHPTEAVVGTVLAAIRDKDLLDFTDRAVFTARRKAVGAAGAPHAEHFDQAVRELWRVELPTTGVEAIKPRTRTPLAVRHLTGVGEGATNLSRFWSQVGDLLDQGEGDTLVPDPYLSSGLLPPLSATFRDASPSRKTLPVFLPERCTACGQCWASCPEAAVGPVALTGQGLLEAGMALAEAKGVRMDALKPIMGKLAPRIAKGFQGENPPTAAGEALEAAFAWLFPLLPMPEDRKVAIRQAFDAACAEVRDLPVATTPTLFGGANALLSLSINPDACKGCGLCAASCPEEAIALVDQTATLVSEAQASWERWESLPDTPAEVIEAALQRDDISTLAAVQLSRSLLLTLPGGDLGEAGSGQRLALRAVLATGEYQLQPKVVSRVAQLEATEAKLRARLRELLAAAIPADNLDALADSVGGVKERSLRLSALLDTVDDGFGKGLVDVALTRRLVKAARDIAGLRWQLTTGPRGFGRARVGLMVAPGAVSDWATAFPYNPFMSPVVLGSSDVTAQMARGLLEAQLRQAVEAARTTRIAEAELERPQSAAKEADALAGLTWADLTEAERLAAPPLFLIGDESALTGQGLTELAALVRGDLPVKVILLAELDLGASRVGSTDGSLDELGLISLGCAYVLQSSIAHPEHLVSGLQAAIAHPGPALVRIHAPAPGRHGFKADATLVRAAQAVESRAFPLFSFDPRREGTFGTHLSLEGNPAPAEDWAAHLTPAHWAAGEDRFGLAPLPAGVAGVALFSWLGGQQGVPYVEDGDRKLAVPLAVAEACRERAHTWATLQELAGIKTPFTAGVRAEVEAELTARHAAELAALQAKHAAELAGARSEVEAELSTRVHARLMTLAGYGRDAR